MEKPTIGKKKKRVKTYHGRHHSDYVNRVSPSRARTATLLQHKETSRQDSFIKLSTDQRLEIETSTLQKIKVWNVVLKIKQHGFSTSWKYGSVSAWNISQLTSLGSQDVLGIYIFGSQNVSPFLPLKSENCSAIMIQCFNNNQLVLVHC